MALSVVRLLVCALILAAFVLGIFDYVKNIESNGCEMTYMFQPPQYLPVTLDTNISSGYPRYNLYLYAEGRYAAESRNMRLNGIPVLFIPGNAGSYRQVRSLGSVALRKAADSKTAFHFNYFSIDYNEELSGLFGGVLQEQTEFAAACVKHILTLYSDAASKPKSVVVVGHSMGGLIARALYTVRDFPARLVHTVITQATPHHAPVVAMDNYVQAFYDDVNGFWARHHNTTLKEVTVVSTGGGYRDVLVRSHLTSLHGIVDDKNAVTSNTMSVPRAFTSTDHLCHVWCKQIVLTIKRALFNAVDKQSKQIAAGPSYRQGVFSHHLVDNPGARVYKGVYEQRLTMDPAVKWELRQKNSWATSKQGLSWTRYSVVRLPPVATQEWAYVAISNINNTEWLGLCTPQLPDPSGGKRKEQGNRCRDVINVAHTATMLPPYSSERKVVHVSGEQLEGQSHVIAVLPQTTSKLEVVAELYEIAKRHLDYNVTDLLSFITGIPNSVTSFEVVIPRTEPGAVFYSVALRGLSIPLQAYRAYITCLECKTAPSADEQVVAKFHVPWAHEDTYTVLPASGNGTVSLKLQSGRPGQPSDAEGEEERSPQLMLYLHPGCVYRLAVAISWPELLGQFVRFYAVYLPAFLAINVLMSLVYQLKALDEQAEVPDLVTAHAAYAQPWRVVPLALFFRFLLFSPEEMPLASRLYLPREDSASLRAQHIWYAALPLLLYVIANAVFALYSVFLTAAVAVMGRLYGFLFGRCCLSVGFVRTMGVLELLLYALCLPVASCVCGSLALVALYLICLVKTLWLYCVARYSGLRAPSVWNAHNAHLTLLVLHLLLVALNAPALVVWAKNISMHEYVLQHDPSRYTGVVMTISAALLSLGRFPRVTSEVYGAVATLVYACAVFMVIYCLTSVYRVAYFLASVFLLLGVSAVSLHYTALKYPPGVEAGGKDADEKPKAKTTSAPSQEPEQSPPTQAAQGEGGVGEEEKEEEEEQHVTEKQKVTSKIRKRGSKKI